MRTNLDLIMITGDLTDSPTVEAVEEVLPHIKTINSPWYMAFGNHDISISGWLTKKRYIEILNQNNPNFNFDNSYYTFIPKKGFKFIVLDPIIDTKVTGNGIIPDEQMQWLDNEIEQSNNDAIMIFMHTPVKEPFKSPGHRLLNADELVKLIKKHNKPIAIFTGHYHASKISSEDNILYVCSPALVTYPNAFRLINVKNGKDTITYELTFIETTKKEIQNKAKLKLFAAQTYAGTDQDKNAIYTLKK